MSASTTGYQSAPGGWDWPADLPKETGEMPGPPPGPKGTAAGEYPQTRERKRPWGPRQCRICLDTVHPTVHEPPELLPGIFQGAPFVTYDSPDGGRLIRPCKCKGSAKYVHDTCLQEWRHADPSYGRRNYYQCPTCGFNYRLERMQWGLWIRSTTMQIILTGLIFLMAIFVLGFCADPIIDFCLDPSYAITRLFWRSEDSKSEVYLVEDKPSWSEHFAKGFASLGLLGFLKIFLQFRYLNLRLGGGRGNGNGRDRINAVTLIVILTGVITFLMFVWKIVRSWSRRFLEKAGERVIDVQGDDFEDEDEAADEPTNA